jgi:hypothetical protein
MQTIPESVVLRRIANGWKRHSSIPAKAIARSLIDGMIARTCMPIGLQSIANW